MDWSQNPQCPFCHQPIVEPSGIDFTSSDYAELICDGCENLFSMIRLVTVDYATYKPRRR